MCECNKNQDIKEDAKQCECNQECECSCEEENQETENQQKEEQVDSDKIIADLKDRYVRLQADFINYKKRVEKEKQSIYKYANQSLITDLLGSLDNMERAIDSVDEESKKENLYTGIEMVYKQILEIFKKNELEEIDALNCKFDPNLHHAVMQDTIDEDGEDTVTEVFQKGYKLHDRVIRPSVVKVSKKRV
ncbi:nucleotide exchange factor GrpE [Clostridiaceae bacterium M8S5]|nr:nucleotide exchange factor GrpE [Clostridiaceae bacterium M8S5]